MKKRLLIPVMGLLTMASGVMAQIVTFDGHFAVQTSDPFGTESYISNTVFVDNANLGWKNNGSNEVFKQLLQFDVSGVEGDVSSAQAITLTLNSIGDWAGVGTASLYLAGISSVDVVAQGFGNAIGSSFGMQTAGTVIDGSISSGDSLIFDVTSAVQALDYSTDKLLFFRLQLESPTSNPGGSPLGTADLSGSTLSITAIPEPSQYAALGGLLALGFVLWRRRR